MNAVDERRARFFRAWAEVEPSFDEERVRARLLAAHRRAEKQGRVVREGLWSLAAVAAIAAVVTLWSRPTGTLSFTTPSGKGEVGAWLATEQSREMPIAFSENTKIVLNRDSRGRVERVGQKGAHFLIERGGVHAEVVHREGNDWRFLAGPFEVRVTGTVLNVSWDPTHEQFSVRVENGSVVVNGPYLGGAQVVRTGELCTVDVPSKSMHLVSDVQSDARDVHSVDAVASADPVDNTPARAPSLPASADPSRHTAGIAGWSELEGRGDYDGAYAAAQRVGIASLVRGASADSLLELAKVGQFSSHQDLQQEALLAARHRFPGTRQAALAAYELGREAPPAEAALWFDAYLSEQPSGPLAREAAGRLLEAESLSKNEPAVRDAARRYLAKYPDGPHAALARRALVAGSGGD
jgi:hypothetical protein